MKSLISKYLFAGFAAAGLLAGCANNDDYSAPDANCINPGLTANKTVQSVASAVTNATPVLYTADDIIEAYVTSSDERGSFFKSISLQTNPTDNSQPIGFSVSVDDAGMFTKGFVPGTKVYIKLKDLYTAKDFGSLKIGALYDGAVGRIDASVYKNHLFVSTCEKVSEDELVQTLTIAQAKADNKINTLIELEGVQFKEESFGYSYYDADAPTSGGSNPRTVGGATNHLLVDASGNEIIFRTSSYANFAGSPIPTGSGKVRGVLTKFNSDYQFIPRYESDVMLDQPRLSDENPGPGPGPGPGAVSLFPGGDFENFTAFLNAVNSFGLKPYATQGTGNGMNNSNSLQIITTGASGNDYVFTMVAQGGLPATYSKIHFYVKGTSAKSLSLNVYKNGSGYYPFNVGDLTTSKTISPAGNNQYSGTIDTAGQWVLVTLDLSTITDLNTSATGDLFALKVGSGANYNLQLDNFVIE